MTTEHSKTLTLSLTSATLLSVSQATIACAFGILLGSRRDKKNQATVALGLMVVAVATFVPAVGGVVVDLINGPRSKLGVRRRLRSIREGSGLQKEEQLYEPRRSRFRLELNDKGRSEAIGDDDTSTRSISGRTKQI